MRITLPYGSDTLEADCDWLKDLGTLDIAAAPALTDVASAARHALENPIGQDSSIFQRVQPGESIAIVVSDSFRKTGIEQVLPVLLDGLHAAGVRGEDIFFLYSTGTHRGPTPEEEKRILGEEVYARFHTRAFSHDAADASQLVSVGTTSRGTPVALNRRLVEAARVIVTGATVFHYFGGFGGGRKSIVPGLASVETIAHNHARNLHATEDRLDPAVRIGALEGNPVAEDMMEGARFCPVDCTINTVLNRDGAIAALYAGDLEASHRAAAERARELYAVRIQEQADLVIASAGPAKNFIQSHKALFNAFQAMKPGGRLIFAARAPEGFGGNKFTQWLSLGKREAIIAELRRNAEINGQTALSTREKAPHAFMLTELSEADAALTGAQKTATLEEALERTRALLAANGIDKPTCYLMPTAAYTVPFPIASASSR